MTDGENATVLGPSHGLVVKALLLAAIAAGVGTRTQQHKSTKFADQTDEARAFKLSVRLSPTETLTGISVELCPNGNRFWRPDPSFNYLVGGHEQAGRHGEAERLRGFEIDYRFEFGCRLHRKVGGLVAAQDAVDIGCRLPERVDQP